jgi:hypothetical protein
MHEWLKSIWEDPVWSKLIAAGIAGGAGWLVGHYRNRKSSGGSEGAASDPIKITYPRPGEILADGKPQGSGQKFPIRGTLKYLPKDHEVWILTKDDATGLVWPQGFSPVVFNQQEGTWNGWIFAGGRSEVRIIAVVAPPTSQEFFRYFQKVGGLRENKFEPLVRVPAECVNQDSVQGRIPKA